MKLLYYLAQKGKEDRFQRLFQELDVVVTFFDLEQVKSLTNFVARERAIPMQNVILLDLEGSEFSHEHILSAVQQLRRISPAQFIVFSPAGGDTDLLFGKLAGFRVSDLVPVGPHTDLDAELRDCLMGECGYQTRMKAMQRAMSTAANEHVRPLMIPSGLVLEVAVAGTMPRVGVTTQVFALWYYLKGLGFRPAVLDGDGRLTGLLWPLYQSEGTQEDWGCTIRGIPFSSARSERFDAYLTDLSMLEETTLAQFSAADLSILVTGVKPWELPALAQSLALLRDRPATRLVTLASFAVQKDLELIQKYLGAHWAAVSYHPDPWEAGSTSAYHAAILPQLKDYCGDER